MLQINHGNRSDKNVINHSGDFLNEREVIQYLCEVKNRQIRRTHPQLASEL